MLRPGFMELIGNLRAGPLTFPNLLTRGAVLPRLKQATRRSRIYRNLKSLEERGLVEFVKDSEIPPAPLKKGRPTTGAWRMTAKGQELWDRLPEITAKVNIIETVKSAAVEGMIPLSVHPSTEILAIGAPCASDKARNEIRKRSVPGQFLQLGNGAQQAARFFWRWDRTFERDWKRFQTVRSNYPRDRDKGIPGVPRVAEPVARLPLCDLLQFKDYPAHYRRARGGLAKHSITFVITADPTLWADSDMDPHLEARRASGPICAERVNSDTEGTGTCDLPTGHDGPHYARVTWTNSSDAPFAYAWDSGGPLRRLYEQPSPSRPGRKRGK